MTHDPKTCTNCGDNTHLSPEEMMQLLITTLERQGINPKLAEDLKKMSQPKDG